MDTLVQSDTINTIQGKCKHDLIQNIALFISKNSRIEGYRFTINEIETRIRELGRKCGVQAHPHKFRRTFATNLVEQRCSNRTN